MYPARREGRAKHEGQLEKEGKRPGGGGSAGPARTGGKTAGRTPLRQSLGKTEESEIYPKDSGEPLKEVWKEEQSIVVFAFKKMCLSAAQRLQLFYKVGGKRLRCGWAVTDFPVSPDA